MKPIAHAPVILLFVSALAPLPLLAQAPPAKPAANTAAKPAAKPAPRPTPRAAAPVAAAPALAAASAEQVQAAETAHLGTYECEFNETVRVSVHPREAGYIDVAHNQNTWTMKPVISSTGALRLEDVRGRMLMLQIANKSMLMDVRIGQRVVDNCMHEKQKAFAAQPPAQSLGISAPVAAPLAPMATPAASPAPGTR